MLPKDFMPLAGIVSDFHVRMPAERACEEFLWTQGARRDIAARVWNWMVRIADSDALAETLLRRLRTWTGTLISLGDHFSHVVNEHGLGEQRARVNALAFQNVLHRCGWGSVIHVPSDHDVGVPHRLTGWTNER